MGTAAGGTSSSNSWSIGGPSTKRGSSLYKPATGNYRSGRPGYYGAGHSQAGTYAASQGMSFTRKAHVERSRRGRLLLLLFSVSRASQQPQALSLPERAV